MRHPYTTNAQRLSSAQTMHDRATDDRTDFSDWHESDDYRVWLFETSEDIYNGKEVAPYYERDYLANHIVDVANMDWGKLADTEKDMANDYHEWHRLAFVAACTVGRGKPAAEHMASRAFYELDKHRVRLADYFAGKIAERYFNDKRRAK